MWINSKQRAEPYLGLTCLDAIRETGDAALRGETYTGAAWLSSARVVRCRVKSFNERNPCRLLPASNVGDSNGTAGVKPEEGGDDVKSSWPLCLGLHTCYNGGNKATQDREVEQIAKISPQFGLQAGNSPA